MKWFMVLLLLLLAGCTVSTPNVQLKDIPVSQPKECIQDSDCVKASCCHASSCTPNDKAPNCSDTFCTLECIPNTLDCNQGSCSCVNNKCQAVFN